MSKYLQELIPQLTYDRWDYVRSLRALLPRGRAWIIPLPDEKDIRLHSIDSAEMFGRITLFTGNILVTPNGILSGESFGLPNMAEHKDVILSGIPSAESFGSLTLSPHLIIAPNGIITEEVLGVPSISGGGSWTQYCGFETTLCSGWDSAFLSNWYQTTENGEGIAQRASDGDDRLYPPTGQLLTGDFTVEFGFWHSANEGFANISIHMELFNAGGMIYDSMMIAPHIISNGAQRLVPTGPVEIRMKIDRISGNIWSYFWDGSQWARIDIWPTPGNVMVNSDDLYLVVNGADGVNGFSYIGIDGTLV